MQKTLDQKITINLYHGLELFWGLMAYGIDIMLANITILQLVNTHRS
jgi:hypothetical protein